MKLTAMVVDDEPLARRKLSALIKAVPWLTQIGEAADGANAIEAIVRRRPDIVFLDIRMPELSGIEIVDRLRACGSTPAVVFTTAYEEYAVTAFELAAVDYLLKPFGAQRFLAAAERARQAVEQQSGTELLERARLALTRSGTPSDLSDRIFVRDGKAVVPLTLTEIVRLEAQDDYVMIYARERRFLIHLRLQDLENRLPRPPFLRVHRSHIVNLDHVDRMVWRDDARADVHMRGGAVITASRTRSQDIRQQSH